MRSHDRISHNHLHHRCLGLGVSFSCPSSSRSFHCRCLRLGVTTDIITFRIFIIFRLHKTSHYTTTHLRLSRCIVAKLTRFSSSIFCIQYGRSWLVHQFFMHFFAILPMSSDTLCKIEASQDSANFLSFSKCSHSTTASIMKTPTSAEPPWW
jgi:hypothetical protein